jgi:rhodanese-related sulfurtransferase
MDRLLEFTANHPFLIALLVAILALLAWNLFGAALVGVRQVVPAEAVRLINHENAMVLDVRGEGEFAQGHILNARNIPARQFAERLAEIEKHRAQVMIACCATGAESLRICRQLQGHGFEKVYCLKGGLAAWQNAGLPVTRAA